MKRLNMKKIKELLRQKHEGIKHRDIALSCGVGASTVSVAWHRAQAAGLGWSDVQYMSETEVQTLVFGTASSGRCKPGKTQRQRRSFDVEALCSELLKPGVTAELLWQEYRSSLEQGELGYGYSQFCTHLRAHKKMRKLSMRQEHRAGEKAFVDYSGKKLRLTCPETGAVTEVELFVMVLGASGYCFAEATYTQQSADFLGSIMRGFAFFGGVPKILVPDNLRGAVTKAHRYEPDINPACTEMAQHYGTVVIPARPYKPKDKALVEGAVLIVQRRVIAVLRKTKFATLAELNAAIRVLVTRSNSRRFQKREGTRDSLFHSLDKPALLPLPSSSFEVSEQQTVRVPQDYHVLYAHRFYSVPHQLAGLSVLLRATSAVVEIFHHGQRVASHVRLFGDSTCSTQDAHRSIAHREYGHWNQARIQEAALAIGPSATELVAIIFASSTHLEVATRAALGIVRQNKQHVAGVLEQACAQALLLQSPSCKTVLGLLSPLAQKYAQKARMETPRPAPTACIRGPEYYRDNQPNPTHTTTERFVC